MVGEGQVKMPLGFPMFLFLFLIFFLAALGLCGSRVGFLELR